MREAIRVLSILATAISVLWFLSEQTYEPAIALVLGIAGILGTLERKPATPRELPITGSRKKILYVDDDLPRTRHVMLDEDGYKVIVADTADKALLEVRRQKFDLILLDVMMPPPRFVSKEAVAQGYETGIYVAKEIKKTRNRDTPIVVITANPMADVETEMRSVGVHSYLRKPFSQRDLDEEILSALSRQE